MPFTLSHAAAAIPFRRTPLIMSALVVGCFVPDFHYFIFLSRKASFSHTVPGMFLLDLPLAIAALWLFHTFIKRPSLMFLSAGMRRRLNTSTSDFPFWPAKRFAIIVLSILIGTATHLLWDSFTHRTSWICLHWAFLRETLELPMVGEMKMWKLLEYASSFFGLAIVVVWIWHWYRTTRPCAASAAQHQDIAHQRVYVTLLPIVATLGGILRAYLALGIQPHIRPIVHFAAIAVVSSITLFLLGLMMMGVVLRRSRPVAVKV